VKYLYLDVGGVLLTNGWDHVARGEASRVFGIDYEDMALRHDFIYNVYEIGKISLDQYLDTVVFHRPRHFTRAEFTEFMFSRSEELPDTLPWLAEWKLEHPEVTVISINNEARDLNRYRIERFGLHRLFDAFVSSCEVGMRKPDPGIFRLALGLAQTEPSSCLYFDDREMLVASAASVGLDARLHESTEATCAAIDEWVKR